MTMRVMPHATGSPECHRRMARGCDAGAVAARDARCTVMLLALVVAACGGEAAFRPDAPSVASRPAPPPAQSTPTPVAVVPPTAPPAPPPPPPKADWQLALEDGIESYDSGAYGNAIRKLEEVADNPRADKASRLQALKYLAFSHCVSPDTDRNRKSPSHLTLCRQAFERALAIDPAFELAQAERGHPVWGKQFQAARTAQSKKTSSGSAPGTNPDASQPSSVSSKKGATTSAIGGSAETGKP
jgi:hypothetical protein